VKEKTDQYGHDYVDYQQWYVVINHTSRPSAIDSLSTIYGTVGI